MASYTDLDISLILAFIGILIALIAILLDMRSKYSNLQSDYNTFKKDTESALFYSDNRRICHDLDLFEEARKSKLNCKILLLGINALGVFHQGYEKIIETLNNDNKVHVLLLSPNMEGFFGKRVASESNVIGGHRDSTRKRLLSEWNASMMIIADIVQKSKKPQNLEIRKYDQPVKYGITSLIYTINFLSMTDEYEDAKSVINCYSGSGRGYKNKQFLCRFNETAERYFFKETNVYFMDLWKSGKPISDFHAELQPLN